MVIEPRFEDAWPFANGVAVVRLADETEHRTIDRNGEFVSGSDPLELPEPAVWTTER